MSACKHARPVALHFVWIKIILQNNAATGTMQYNAVVPTTLHPATSTPAISMHQIVSGSASKIQVTT